MMTYGELKKLILTIPQEQDNKLVWIRIDEYPYYIEVDPDDFRMTIKDQDDYGAFYDFDGFIRGTNFIYAFMEK